MMQSVYVLIVKLVNEINPASAKLVRINQSVNAGKYAGKYEEMPESTMVDSGKVKFILAGDLSRSCGA
jgi:hypothetical protein